jgi:hypothetical protein
MLQVMVACCAKWDHSWKGKFLSVMHKPLMKWFLKVCMARSAALTRWLYGSTSWMLQFFVVRNCLMGALAWLSVTLSVGV